MENFSETLLTEKRKESSAAITTVSSSNGRHVEAPVETVSRSVIYTPHTTVAPTDTKPLLSDHFAQEFHESVLKETQQQRASKGQCY